MALHRLVESFIETACLIPGSRVTLLHSSEGSWSVELVTEEGENEIGYGDCLLLAVADLGNKLHARFD